ncbi:glycosyltransferase family protein, partial [Aequorivita antarctica]
IFGIRLLIKYNRFKLSKSKIREGQLIGYTLYTLENQLKDISLNFTISSFIWEYTWPKYWYIPLIVKKTGLKVVGLPHNLESLVYSQKSYKKPTLQSPYWLDEEIQYLSWCDEIFTISREEQWLLSLLLKNIEVKFLPYFATKLVFQNLLRIRNLRANEKLSNHIMVLGSAVNPPTLKSLVQLKEYIKNEKIDNINFDFVGFHMSFLTKEDEKLPDNIEIFDNVPDKILENKLSRAICALIYQVPSTGALTRILELQLAGVPIVVNCHAARSYFNKKGILIYENLNDLKNKLNDIPNLEIPEIPSIDNTLENNFINAVIC